MKLVYSFLLIFSLFFAPTATYAAEPAPFEKIAGVEKGYATWYRNVIPKDQIIKFSWQISSVAQDTTTKTFLLFLDGYEKEVGTDKKKHVCSSIFVVKGESLTAKYLRSATLVITDDIAADACKVVLKSDGETVNATLFVTYEGPMPVLEENKKK